MDHEPRSPVASTYSELQDLPRLFQISHSDEVELGSEEQAQRCLLQASEICVVTMATSVMQANTTGNRKHLNWAATYASIWADLAWKFPLLEPLPREQPSHLPLAMTASPNVLKLQMAEKQFVDTYERGITQEADQSILDWSMAERCALEQARLSVRRETTYDEYSRSSQIWDLVSSSPAPANTVFVPFRSIHQISELIVEVINDHIKAVLPGTLAIGRAISLLLRATTLMDGMISATSLFGGTLNQSDYHTIREHLGLTSGSHSLGIRYHLMRDLYPALSNLSIDLVNKDSSDDRLLALFRLVRTLGVQLDRWRMVHLALPRNNLGGPGTETRSLTGSLDSVRTVSRMRVHARTSDAMRPGGEALLATDWRSPLFPLAGIESEILEERARLTHERFTDVQARTGLYSTSVSKLSPFRREEPGREED